MFVSTSGLNLNRFRSVIGHESGNRNNYTLRRNSYCTRVSGNDTHACIVMAGRLEKRRETMLRTGVHAARACRVKHCERCTAFRPNYSVRRRSRRTFSTHFEIFRRRVGIFSLLFLCCFYFLLKVHVNFSSVYYRDYRAVVTASRHRPFCFHNFVFLLNCLFCITHTEFLCALLL